jgi:hypothetical protein
MKEVGLHERGPVSVWANGFVLQIIISSLPSVLVVASLPIIGTSLGMTIAQVGFLFLLARLGAIAGSQIAPYLAERWDVRKISVVCELISLLLASVLYCAAIAQKPSMFFWILPFKAVCTGLLVNVRGAWLKSLSPGVTGQRIFVILNALTQVFYGVSAVVLLCHFDPSTITKLILLDAFSSLVGALIFYQMPSVPKYTASIKNIFSHGVGFLIDGPKRWILLTDCVLAVAMGGTNILLVTLGPHIFGKTDGYAFSLLIYGLAYLVAGFLTQGRLLSPQGSVGKFLSVAPIIQIVSFCVLFLSSPSHPVALAVAFFVFFTCYPLSLLHLDSLWFKTVKREESSQLFALRMLIVGLIWAVGEPAYAALTISTAIVLRLVFLSLAAICLLVLNKKLAHGLMRFST